MRRRSAHPRRACPERACLRPSPGRACPERRTVRRASPRPPAADFTRSLGAALLALAAWAALVSCGGRSLGGSPNDRDAALRPDATTRQDAAAGPDATARPDGGAQCQPNEWWELVPTPLESVTVLTQIPPEPGPAQDISVHISVRLEAFVRVGGPCEQMAGVSPMPLRNNLTEVHLQGYLWRYRGPASCPVQETLVPELLVLRDLQPGAWTVWDDFSMDGPGPNQPMASFTVRDCFPGEDCDCALWDGIPGVAGSSCRYDCQCEWPLACLYEGLVSDPMAGTCERSCSTDSDCPLPEECNMGVLDMPDGICQGWRQQDECGPGVGDCPPGWSCEPFGGGLPVYLCVPAPTSVFPGDPCTDSCDCAAGFFCSQTDAAGARTCQIPCRGNGDCPEGLLCEDPGGSWLVNNHVCGSFNDL